MVVIGGSSNKIYDFLNVELDELPKGEILPEHLSPNQKFVVIAEVIDEVGITLRAAIRVEIDYGDNTKTIYWNYDESSLNIRG
ncbi:DUF5412 family protein [Lysinibacillus endophyticus]|uniref:Uncharacterized protein n=1 Tax=Ureibacillus endophyticus TaxID=1978490 RepID=A0A494Z3S5_9BACL|nr:DUF5412 family protein [Lysinibacillus endophyticus]MCP1144907.1 DUF5412 domain-containing protein [Lysinibacillus endophyticus]RKQ16954.1 hypothetical protein D8M03_08740 [Lysinibacillus endophyticus]